MGSETLPGSPQTGPSLDQNVHWWNTQDLTFLLCGVYLQERQRQQAEQQEAEKAGKAAAAEQVLRERSQARLREQQEAQQRLAAHKQGVRAAKTRINRAALQGLGQAFAARLQVLLCRLFLFAPALPCALFVIAPVTLPWVTLWCHYVMFLSAMLCCASSMCLECSMTVVDNAYQLSCFARH